MEWLKEVTAAILCFLLNLFIRLFESAGRAVVRLAAAVLVAALGGFLYFCVVAWCGQRISTDLKAQSQKEFRQMSPLGHGSATAIISESADHSR